MNDDTASPRCATGQAIPREQSSRRCPSRTFAGPSWTPWPAGSESPPCSATHRPRAATVDLYAVLADSARGLLRVGKTTLDADRFPSLTPDCPQVHLFEREIAEQYGVRPEGHPWFKPVRFHASYRPGHDAWGRKPGEAPVIGVTDFYRVEGEEIHEVAVGPVHAGVIEPGHFRFQCHGEQVFHLEISLGYQHRGVERTLVGGPNKRTIHTMETVAGDTSIGHATAYCQAVEALAGCQVPIRAEVLRGIALELERLANHTGDLGALAGDVGFLPTASYCGRLRGDFLNLTALLCGSRFGRGLVRPGGVGFDLDDDRKRQCLERLEAAYPRRGRTRPNLLWDSASVQARFEGTGAVSPEDCLRPGAGRPGGAGLRRRVRRAPRLPGRHLPLRPGAGLDLGDRRRLRPRLRALAGDPAVGGVHPRASCRRFPDGPIRADVGPLKPDHLVVIARRRLARRDLSCGPDRWPGPLRPLQDRRSVVPQLDGPGDGAARPADFRLPAVQQELQPVVLRTRPVRRTSCCKSRSPD